MKIFLIVFVTGVISGLAFMVQSLSLNGAFIAWVIGTLIGYGGSSYGYTLLGLFFITSSFWSHYKEERKYHLYHLHEKGTKRDAIQVLANGLVPAICSIAYVRTQQECFLVAMAVSLASATADTWASEIGVLSQKPARSILTFKILETGLSGGVTLLGSLAQVGGACLIALFSTSWLKIIYHSSMTWGFLWLTIAGFGILGSIIDSYLGALIQVKYECVECYKITERPIHHEKRAKRIRGWRYMSNDWVNLISQSLVTLLSIFFIA